MVRALLCTCVKRSDEVGGLLQCCCAIPLWRLSFSSIRCRNTVAHAFHQRADSSVLVMLSSKTCHRGFVTWTGIIRRSLLPTLGRIQLGDQQSKPWLCPQFRTSPRTCHHATKEVSVWARPSVESNRLICLSIQTSFSCWGDEKSPANLRR